MNDNPEEEFEFSPALDDDVWVRGVVYVRHKESLAEAEVQLVRLEQNAARARYEYDIAQRIRDKTESPESRRDWNIQASVAHDFVVIAEQELAEVTERAAYHRAMVAEVETDLGDKAEVYESILGDLSWEDWDEEDLDEACPFFDECPFLFDENWEDFDDYEADQNLEDDVDSTTDAEVPF